VVHATVEPFRPPSGHALHGKQRPEVLKGGVGKDLVLKASYLLLQVFLDFLTLPGPELLLHLRESICRVAEPIGEFLALALESVALISWPSDASRTWTSSHDNRTLTLNVVRAR